MIEQTGSSVASTAYGKKLETDITYDYKWSDYPADGAELIAAKDELTIAEQVKVRNTERQNNARQKALKAALDAAGIVKPTAENDPQIGLRDMVKTMMTAKLADGSRKYTEEQAWAAAEDFLGVKREL